MSFDKQKQATTRLVKRSIPSSSWYAEHSTLSLPALLLRYHHLEARRSGCPEYEVQLWLVSAARSHLRLRTTVLVCRFEAWGSGWAGRAERLISWGGCYNHYDSSLRKTGDIRWTNDGVRAHGGVEVFVWEDLRDWRWTRRNRIAELKHTKFTINGTTLAAIITLNGGWKLNNILSILTWGNYKAHMKYMLPGRNYEKVLIRYRYIGYGTHHPLGV